MNEISYLGQWAKYYASCGIAILPLKPNSKEPLGRWRHRQRQPMSDQEVVDVWSQQPNANIGIVCGAINQDLAVVDLDSAVAIAWADQNLPPTPCRATTPRGEHRYFKASGVRNSTKLGGIDVDLRGEGGYVVAPPSVHPAGGGYSWWPKPDQAPNLAGLPQLPASMLTVVSAAALDALAWLKKKPIPQRHPDHPDDSHTMLLANARKLVQKFRLEREDLLGVLLAWNAEISDDANQWSENELEHKVDEIFSSRSTTPDIAGLLERYTLIAGSAQIWDGKLRHAVSVQAVKLEHPGVADHWLRHPERRLVSERDIVFAPGGCAPHQINRFAGLPCRPDATKPHQKIVEHVWHLCGADQELWRWVMSWLAVPLKSLGTKMQSAMVLVGPQGSGKSLFGEVMREIYGDRKDGGYATVISQDDLESTFNGWATESLFVVAEEVASSQNRRDRKNPLKHLITGNVVRANEKYEKARDVANHFNLMFLSNEAVPLLLEADDRRHCVVRVPPAPPPPYFDQLLAEIRGGGACGFLEYLLKFDVGSFNPGSLPPMTAAKMNLMEASSPPELKFLTEWIEGRIHAPNQARHLYAAFRAWCAEHGIRPPSSARFNAVAAEHAQIRRVRSRAGGVDQIVYLRPGEFSSGSTGA